jgi:flagellar biosynthesis chaperone FliJ
MGAEPSVQPLLKGSTTDRGFAMAAYQDYVQKTTAKQLEYARQLADAKQLGASADQIRQMQIDQNKHLADRIAAAQKMLPHAQKGNDEEFNKIWQERP